MKYKFFTFYFLLFLVFYFISFYSYARITASEYINIYKYEAINEMLEYGIPASITIAQGMLESDCGNSPLALNAHNHFGIKCHVEWNGPTYIQDDDKKDECFRVYEDPRESYRDHSLFLKERPRYANLFTLNMEDYKAWAKGLKQAGYATNPAYAEKLIKIIEENELHKFDKIKTVKAVKHLKEKDKSLLEVASADYSIKQEASFSHEVRLNNKTEYVVARKGDTYYSIAKEFDLDIRLLYRYNDLQNTTELSVGQYLYLKPKRTKAEVEFHTVKPGDSMYSISQQYGIKLKKLYRKNNMEVDSQLAVGEIISLKDKLRK